jgi:sulfur carrier protein
MIRFGKTGTRLFCITHKHAEVIMEITVNGQRKEYGGPPYVSALLEALGIHPRPVVVERNLRIVQRTELEKEPVQDGDSFEIIRFVGGG